MFFLLAPTIHMRRLCGAAFLSFSMSCPSISLAQSSNAIEPDGDLVQLMECFAELHKSPAVVAMLKVLPIDIGRASDLELLANKKKATSKEKVHLSTMVTDWGKCLGLANQSRRKSTPTEIADLYVEYWIDTKALLADLYAGSATYGDVAKARVKLEASYATKVQQKVDALIQQQAQNEQARQVAESQRQYAESQVRNAEAQRQQQLEAELQRQRVAQQQLEQQQAQLLLLQRQQRQAESAAAFNNGMMLLQAAQPKLNPSPPRPSINCQSHTLQHLTASE